MVAKGNICNTMINDTMIAQVRLPNRMLFILDMLLFLRLLYCKTI